MTIPLRHPLTPAAAASAEPVVDRRSLEDPRAELLELERQGELIVQRIDREAVACRRSTGA